MRVYYYILYIVDIVCVEIKLRAGKIYDVVFIARTNGLRIYMRTSSTLSLYLTVNNTDGGGSGRVRWTDAAYIG